MTNIPKARDLLISARENLDDLAIPDVAPIIDQIDDALSMMTRRINKTPAKASARKITPAIINGVLYQYAENPDLSNREIGDMFGIDGGRVSEIINGKRTIYNCGLSGDGFSEEIREARGK